MRTVQRLSSGLRINVAGDDAAGLAISERMTSSIRSADQSRRNVNDSVSFLQVAEGVMSSVVDRLQRLRELAVQTGNAAYSAADKAALQREADQLLQGITSDVGNAKFNGETLFSESTSSIGGDANKRALLDRLKIGWFNEAEQRIQTYFGIDADGAQLTIDVDNFTDGASNVLAYVQGAVNGDGTWSNLSMSFDMADFSPPDLASDRVVAHELVHAVMARSMNFSSLPQWFQEGMAELIHGADERLASAIGGLGAAAVVGVVAGGGFSYESAYLASRYLHDQLKDMGVAGGIKGLMQYLSENAGSTLNTALNAVTGGTYANNAAFLADFGANGVAYIASNMNLTNGDTGAIGGLDADGGPVRTSTGVIDDIASHPSVLDGFDERFPTIGGTTGSKSYVLQVGENVGDTLRVSLSALNASALGLSEFDLTDISAINILHVDEALEFVNSQRAVVGASINRLESISATLATRSENLSASRSRIRDADYAEETATLTKTMILQQSATTILAQANATPQLALTLLR